jgi:hypothetical protein
MLARAAAMSALAASAILFAGASLPGCAAGGGGAAEEREMPARPIDDVLADHAMRLMEKPGVAIVYAGQTADGSACIVVGIVEETAEVLAAIPKSLEGYPIVVQVTGEIEPM